MPNTHAAITFRNNLITKKPYQVALIDLDTPSYVLLNGTLGRPRTINYDGSTYLYFASASPAYYARSNGSAVQILGQASQSYVQSSCMAPDGVLFFGLYPNGGVDEYDPSGGTLTALGRADTTTSITQYAYRIRADNSYVWVVLGQSPWYLVGIERSGYVKTVYFGGDASTDTGGDVSWTEARDHLYYTRTLSDGSKKYYLLDSGTPVEVSAGSVPALEESYNQDDVGVWFITLDPDTEFDFSAAGAYTGHDPTIKWRAAGSSDPYDSVEITGISLSPVSFRILTPNVDNDALYGTTDLYGGLWSVPFNLGTGTFIGVTPVSIQDILVASNGLVYLGAYASYLMEWNPDSAWTLAEGADVDTSNPRKVADAPKYPYFLCEASNGWIFCANEHERDSVGGEMVWWNPVAEEADSHRTGTPDLSVVYPSGICACGDHVVWSGRGGSVGELYVFDNTGTYEYTRSLSAGYTDGGVVVAVSSTDVVGIEPNALKAYRMNITTGSIVWERNDLPYNAWGSMTYHKARPYFDGTHVWLTMNHNVYKLDISDGSVTLAQTSDGDYNVKIVNGAILTDYGTTPHLYALP